jgi:hypothetical protein
VRADLAGMTVAVEGAGPARRMRLWERGVDPPPSWDQQDPGGPALVAEVAPDSADWAEVLACFRRPASGGPAAPGGCLVVRVRRVQNLRLLSRHRAEAAALARRRGPAAAAAALLFHGTRTNPPLAIAAGGEGLSPARGQAGGLHGRGCYFALLPRYSHAYAHRTADAEGARPDPAGPFRHLLLARVLLGRPRPEPDPWASPPAAAGRPAPRRLGGAYDSVEGGPHRPGRPGPGEADSLVYVVFRAARALPEFLVTYRAAGP